MRLPLFVLSLLAVTVARAELDLTPNTRSVTFGEFANSWVQFVDGEKKYGIRLDSDAKVSAGEGGTVLRFELIPGAKVTLRRSPLPATVAFDADGLVKYQKAALQMLPAGAERVTQDETIGDAESINHGRSYRFTFSYDLASTRMTESITFLNFDEKQQIIVHAGAFAKDFGAVTARAVDLIRGWHKVRKDAEEGIN